MSGKQCRPRWDAAFCGVSPGSKLSAKAVCPNTYGKYSTNIFFWIFIPRHTVVVGYYGFTLVFPVSIHPSICPSVLHLSVRQYFIFSFPNNNSRECQWNPPNLVCALILYRFGLGLLMGKVLQFFENLLCALILWRSGMGMLMGKFHQFFTVVCLHICIFISGHYLK